VYDEDFAAAVDLLRRGVVRAEPLISDCILLRRALNDGLLALMLEPEAHLKIVKPSGVGA
jgi:hypothetical protein